jgi:sugar phosphate permease
MGAPPCTRLLTYWFSPREIGRAWGLWNASHQIGGALIALWAGWLVAHYGWKYAFWAPAGVGLLVGVWLLFRLTDSPEAMGLPPVEVFRGDASVATKGSRPFREIFKSRILTNRKIWLVSGANFFVYVVRIGILAWTPKYLLEAKAFSLTEASYAISGFEIAGIFGAYGAGWLSDDLFKGRRAPVSVGFLVALVVALLALFAVPPHGGVVIIVVLFVALGFLVYGPQLLIGVAAADFATKEASASAVGFTGFFGYLGASVCGVTTGFLVDALGWDAAIWFYVGAAVIGSILLAFTWRDRSPLLGGTESVSPMTK